MRQLGYFLFLIVTILSCNRDNDMVISDKQFEQILFELYQADAVNQTDQTALGVQDSKKELLLTILARNNVTIQQYDSTVLWYSQNSDRYFNIYENIMRRVDRLEQKNNKEIEKIELLALSPKGDSVLLNKEVKSLRLSHYRDNYTQYVTKDKHFQNLELFRLNYTVPILEQDTLFAQLSCLLKNGSSVERCDTVVGSGARSLVVTVDQELSNVSMKFQTKRFGYKNTPIWISDIEFIRVHIDSTRLDKSLKK